MLSCKLYGSTRPNFYVLLLYLYSLYFGCILNLDLYFCWFFLYLEPSNVGNPIIVLLLSLTSFNKIVLSYLCWSLQRPGCWVMWYHLLVVVAIATCSAGFRCDMHYQYPTFQIRLAMLYKLSIMRKLDWKKWKENEKKLSYIINWLIG